ncbi:MAG TPA: hypothetical protein VGO52_08525 [Hyphomonadaceae bacterium]|jgi:hypothetical protein|nr:hypothetical protein [Hyphomonadaceae bacterium]
MPHIFPAARYSMDRHVRAAMGTNQMDLATRIPSARAGFAQGKREGVDVTSLGRAGLG